MANDPTQAAIYIDRPTTYYTIGKYHIHATDAQKIAACRDAMENAALEMIRLGASLEDVMTATEDAFDAAEIEVQEMGDRG